MRVLVEELAKHIRIALAHLSQHPTNGFVHQVVRMMQVFLRITPTPREFALLGCFPSADDTNALLPKAITCSQFIYDPTFIICISQCRWQQ